ncbi:MAG: hypothetical protein PHN20_08545 [Bacteroidales bacterium]|nr:hypothetical protein [Bacteroidales bacterium]MDD3167458.1 hypothetical protein [Bacteroidales bacterium]
MRQGGAWELSPASDVIDEVLKAVQQWKQFADEQQVHRDLRDAIAQTLRV